MLSGYYQIVELSGLDKMTDNNGIRSGSLQFYPRVRAKKVLPNVNWAPVNRDGVGLMGFVGYKVGMVSVLVKDDTENSLTKGKRVSVPATVVECPAMRIYSVRFYKDGKVVKDIVVANGKDLKRKVKIAKKLSEFKEIEDFDDIRVVLSSGVGKTGIGKKKVDMIEVGISGSKEEKLGLVKERVGKDILIGDVFSGGLVDVRGVTKGFGTGGPMKRFGIALKASKSEKGRRRPGSLAPWHPARTTFRAPQAGQTGYHNRVSYNSLILSVGNKDGDVNPKGVANAEVTDDRLQVIGGDINPKGGFPHYGVVKNDYLILKGSVPGPQKRGIVISAPIRPAKFMAKKKLEAVEVR